jgi:hypothetical protein
VTGYRTPPRARERDPQLADAADEWGAGQASLVTVVRCRRTDAPVGRVWRTRVGLLAMWMPPGANHRSPFRTPMVSLLERDEHDVVFKAQCFRCERPHDLSSADMLRAARAWQRKLVVSP